MKNQNYYFGSNEHNVESVLEGMTYTGLHSIKTSSIPFVEFWMPKNEKAVKKIFPLDIDFDSAEKCFEYPVYALDSGKKLGRPSKSDLMIKTEKYNIAIEGKFTEDLYETIEEWKKDSNKEGSEKSKILKAWYDYIKPYVNFETGELPRIEKNVVYQFLHRLASACYGCIESGKTPILIYHLFYDANDKESFEKQRAIKDKLCFFAYDCLHLSEQFHFYIIMTPVLNVEELVAKYPKVDGRIFTTLSEDNVYSFGESEVYKISNFSV